jgi:hypothetical protein
MDWVVSSYEAIDNRQEKKHQAINDMMAMIGQEEVQRQLNKSQMSYMNICG